MNIVLGVIIGIIVLMFLIVAHEFGHYIAAKRNGVKVNEFGIGFPPRAIAWVKGKDGKLHKIPKEDAEKTYDTTILSLNWIPIGGFCAMDGESDADRRKGTFGAASFWAKTKILFAGVTMNWLVAFVILTILAFTGMPQFINNQFRIDSDAHIEAEPVLVSEVIDNSPAAQAGIQSGDRITAINQQKIITGTEIVNYNNNHAGETVEYTILRDGAEQTVPVTLGNQGSDYLLGVSMASSQTLVRSTWSAPIVGAVTTVQLTGETFRGLGELLWNLVTGVVSQISPDSNTREAGRQDIAKAGDSVSGPVGIIGSIFPAFTNAGPTNLAFLAALISVSLACMNVLPIPALDGGRWLLMAIYRIRGKKLTKETEEKIVSRAFIVLLALIVLITILDVTKFF
ncbi:site-2 protease family protein [Candidatus Saccharibacteria bacterium]|nr:site-2 protease family protein [Candidatus Saccharibacteria bacterium]